MKHLLTNVKMKNFKLGSLLIVALILFCYSVSAQERTIKGNVTDNNGSPLPGVQVLIKGTNKGTLTEADGSFRINVPNSESVLIFKFLGFADQEIKIGEQQQLNVALKEKIEELDQVVVVGYGVQKRSDITGSVASVSGEKISKLPIAGIDQALQGMAAGVNIIPTTGRPGSGVDIQIRGITSINGTNPLIIIDGVSKDINALNRLNPDDVESIEVLKDASSAAIYGASGGNGVILITTKKGKSGEIKTSFNSYMGSEEVIKKLDMMNSQQWLELLEEMSSSSRPITTRPDTFQTYDWQDIVFKRAYTRNYDLSFNGGNERSNFLLSASYSKQEGIIKKTDNQRFTMRLNSDHTLKYFKISENISYTNNVRYGFEDWEYLGYYQNIVAKTLQMVPYLPAYDANGKWNINQYGGGPNPMVELDMKNRKNKNDNIDANFSITIEPIKGLSYTSRISAGAGIGDVKEFRDIYYASATDNRQQNELFQSLSRSYSWNFQNIVTYNTSIYKHNFTLMGGTEAIRYWGYDINGTRVDFSNTIPELLYFSMSENDTLDKQSIEGSGYEGRSYRYFGRFNYDYASKYLLTINVSRDYASNFGPANRAGTFPSFSVGWKFSEEEFIKALNIFSFGKIRIGYGETGANARSGFPYATNIIFPARLKYSFDNVVSQIGAGPEQVANPSIKWETVKMTNIGIDANFFDNKLSLTLEYFNKENEGMLMYQQVPFIAGTFAQNNPEVNIGSIRNRGFEITTGYKGMVGDLRYSADFNISFVRNKILALATDSIMAGAAHNVSPIALTRIGGSVSEFYGYKTSGMFTENDLGYSRGRIMITNQPFSINSKGDTVYAQPDAKPGDVRFADLNGDGKLNEKDKTILGSPLPKFTYSFSINLEFKGFDLNMMFYGSYGNKLFNGTKQYLYYSQGNGNRLAVFANRYKDEKIKDGIVVVRENHNTTIPRFAASNYTRPSDFFIEDGSYLRLRNIQIGYSLPSNLCKKIGVDKFRLYVGAKNLLTFTKYKAYNPEVSSGSGGGLTALGVDYGTYPATKMYLVGLNLQF
ncbi:MAG: TonB-dependent receptor [Bacteroidales bacterium]|nr:TonB-dependent receptor [Bacteroidales bacterium]